jgi:hypothetical protein
VQISLFSLSFSLHEAKTLSAVSFYRVPRVPSTAILCVFPAGIAEILLSFLLSAAETG